MGSLPQHDRMHQLPTTIRLEHWIWKFQIFIFKIIQPNCLIL